MAQAVNSEYKDNPSDCCMGLDLCYGSAEAILENDEVQFVTDIPTGVTDVTIELESVGDSDFDILLFEKTTKSPILRWCNTTADPECGFGPLSSASDVDSTWPQGPVNDGTIYVQYSGFNGEWGGNLNDLTGFGDETLKLNSVEKTTNGLSQELRMSFYAYVGGSGEISYSFRRPLKET